MKNKEPWQIAAARYCVENSEKGFDHKDLKAHIKSLYSVSDGHIDQFVEEELQSPMGRQHSRMGRGGLWIPPLDLVSKVTDYEELKEARRNSKHAFWLAVGAILISIIVGGIQILKIQDVNIKNDLLRTEIINLPILQNNL